MEAGAVIRSQGPTLTKSRTTTERGRQRESVGMALGMNDGALSRRGSIDLSDVFYLKRELQEDLEESLEKNAISSGFTDPPVAAAFVCKHRASRGRATVSARAKGTNMICLSAYASMCSIKPAGTRAEQNPHRAIRFKVRLIVAGAPSSLHCVRRRPCPTSGSGRTARQTGPARRTAMGSPRLS